MCMLVPTVLSKQDIETNQYMLLTVALVIFASTCVLKRKPSLLPLLLFSTVVVCLLALFSFVSGGDLTGEFSLLVLVWTDVCW